MQSVPHISLHVLIVTQRIKVSTLVAPLNATLKILIQNTEKKGGLRVKMSETDTKGNTRTAGYLQAETKDYIHTLISISMSCAVKYFKDQELIFKGTAVSICKYAYD